MLKLFNMDKKDNKNQGHIIPETLLLVFTYLNQKDLATISLVSKYFYNLSSSNLIWNVFSSKLKNWHTISKDSKDLPNEDIDYKNYVFSYNQLFEYQRGFKGKIPEIKIVCLGQAKVTIEDKESLSKKLFLTTVPNSKPLKAGFASAFGQKKHLLNFLDIRIQNIDNMIRGVDFILIFPKDISDLNQQYLNIENAFDDELKKIMHIICCSNDKIILKRAGELSMDIFEINENGLSTLQCQKIQNEIIFKFAEDIKNELTKENENYEENNNNININIKRNNKNCLIL